LHPNDSNNILKDELLSLTNHNTIQNQFVE